MYVLCIIYRIIVILSIVLLQRNKLKVYRNELCNNFTFEKDIIFIAFYSTFYIDLIFFV